MTESKTYIVTGACGGIGSAAARVLCAAGHNVVLSDIAPPQEGLLDELHALGGSPHFISCDITSDRQVQDLVAAAVKTSGRLDGAVNSAGIEQAMKPLADLELETWERVIRVNLTSVFLCMKHEIRAMLETGGGSIVNIGSAIGAVAIENGCEYVASKHGLSGLTKAGALDYAKAGIRVNAVMPGVIKTPMHERHADAPWMKDFETLMHTRHPIGRMGMPGEVGEAVKWLLSDASSFVTGSLMFVDGGYTAV
ncbi:SDR family NAD(P)-dependent oxidoreductase [Novosphingobium beihaiensis]|uniref:SDR family oxidoreductase n=1 Tax=Novosphingobium beihaiensis TaxID=2930389 RepID=A0ABT0BU60_9SPHN|nr:SDR family oxidoreductase [Novosphingobium beihaiensis]MCJ2188433.1 SDR family oxidoreductase [Novosphingobium beihaiensis]